MAQINIKIGRDTQELFRKLGDKNLLRLNDAFKLIGRDFRKTASAIFENTSGNLRYWAQLKPTTAARKIEKYGFIHPTLKARGDLQKSFARQTDRDNVEEIKAQRATFGSENPLADWHQRGAGNLPAREIINKPWVEKNMKRWLSILSGALKTLFRKKGIIIR